MIQKEREKEIVVGGMVEEGEEMMTDNVDPAIEVKGDSMMRGEEGEQRIKERTGGSRETAIEVRALEVVDEVRDADASVLQLHLASERSGTLGDVEAAAETASRNSGCSPAYSGFCCNPRSDNSQRTSDAAILLSLFLKLEGWGGLGAMRNKHRRSGVYARWEFRD